VVRYLAERTLPRVQDALRLKLPVNEDGEDGGGPSGPAGAGAGAGRGGGGEGEGGDGWSPVALCEALAGRHNWRSRRGGRPDLYRAANWLLRGALAGRPGLVLGFLPPEGE
jgi:hypothetical protein